DLAFEIELGSRTYLGSQSALYQLHIRARRKGADRQDLSGECCRWRCLSGRTGGRSDQKRCGYQLKYQVLKHLFTPLVKDAPITAILSEAGGYRPASRGQMIQSAHASNAT